MNGPVPVGSCRLGGFEPNIRFEVQPQQTVLSLVDEGAGIALVPTSMRKAQLAGVVFRPLADAPTISQMLVWSPLNRNPCLARFLEIAWKRRAERTGEESRAPAHSSAGAGKQRYR